MSSISSVSNLNFNPFRLLALLDSQSASATSSSGATQSSSGSNTATTTDTTSTTGTGSTSLWNQLTTAFNNAIQNAEQTGNTSNLASVLQTAGNQVLQNNGINPATFEQQVSGQIQGAHHHHHHHGGSSSSSQASGGSSQASRRDQCDRQHDRHGYNSGIVQPATHRFAGAAFRHFQWRADQPTGIGKSAILKKPEDGERKK